MICLVNSVNERDPHLLNNSINDFIIDMVFLERLLATSERKLRVNVFLCFQQPNLVFLCIFLFFLKSKNSLLLFFELYDFIIPVLASTLVLGINYFGLITHPLHQLQVWKRSNSSSYMIETYNTHHRFPCY